MNNTNEARQGPAFRALVRGLGETSREHFLSFFSIIILITHRYQQSSIDKNKVR